jgi:hypothetical protein
MLDEGREVPALPELAGHLSRFPPGRIMAPDRLARPGRRGSRANHRHRRRIYAP